MSTRPEVHRLEDHNNRLRELIHDTERMAGSWPAGSGAILVEVCAVTRRLLDGTAADRLRGLAGAVVQQVRFTRQYVDAAADVEAAMEKLCTAVAVASDERDPAQAARPRQAVLDLLTAMDHLLDCLDRLAKDRHHGEGWIVEVQQLVRTVRIEVATLRGIAERAVTGTAENPASAAIPSPDSAERLATAVGRLAFQERCQGEALRVAAVLTLLLIAVLAYTVLWRSPTDPAAVALDLAKLATAVPLALIAFYLKQESALHRTGASRLRELEIQLIHVGTYFPPEQQRQHRSEIWSRLTPVLLTPNATDLGNPAEDLPTILERIAELVKSVGSLGRGG